MSLLHQTLAEEKPKSLPLAYKALCYLGPNALTSPPLIHCTSVTVAFLLYLEHDRQAPLPKTEPLPSLFPLPGMFFPSLPTQLALSSLLCLLSKTSPINPWHFLPPLPCFHCFSSLMTYYTMPLTYYNAGGKGVPSQGESPIKPMKPK